MKKQTKITLIIAIVIVMAIIFMYPRMETIMGKSDGINIDNEQSASTSNALPVEVIELRPEPLENNLNITGNIIPNESVNLRPEIPGMVVNITFNEGEFVKQGTPLLYLNDDELKAQYDRLDYTKKLYEGQENRQKQLLSREAISQEEYDIVLNQFNTNLADLRLIDAQLNKTIIRAPFDGVLGLRQVSLGSFISPSDIIVSIVNLDPIKIEFSIPERYSSEIKTGSKIFFSTNASVGEAEGIVYAIEPNIDAATRTLKLRAESPNKDRRFLPGMFVRIRLILNRKENALMVPAESIVPELEGYKVFVARDGVAEEVPVNIGTRTERRVEVVEGLKEGDLVLTTGVLQVKTGTPVAINKIN